MVLAIYGAILATPQGAQMRASLTDPAAIDAVAVQLRALNLAARDRRLAGSAAGASASDCADAVRRGRTGTIVFHRAERC